MRAEKLQSVRKTFLGLTTTLGVLSVGLITYAFGVSTESFEGRLLPKHLQREQQWTVISQEKMRNGDVIEPHINNIIHIPEEVDRITRRTLFGRVGTKVRYWGYCFPRNYEEAEALKRRGFPGTIFLSEAEREERKQSIFRNRNRSIRSYSDLNEEALSNNLPRKYGAIRHQQEIFTGGMTCYVMTEEPIATGTDEDDDGVNIRVEKDHSSDPKRADTDGDGIRDGLEIFYLGTHATRRDTDGDGLIDGVEDANRNGRVNPGESNPTKWDTDGDELCDGLCKVNNGKDLCGEDKNLNGKLDDGETSPTKIDTDGDGILDIIEAVCS